MDNTRIIYSSQPFGFDEATLSHILLTARRLNKRDAVTGALICRHDVYLQLLEGPGHLVSATYERIRRDDRHLDIKTHVLEKTPDRLFGDWDMLHDPARSWLWSSDEIAKGALTTASGEEILGIFSMLSHETKAGKPA